jgi:isoleucyl-tRNA synthetase
MSRVPDVGNPWLDAGIVPYSTMKYNTDRDYWKQWFPAEFITEAFPGQFRNWFYAILTMSTMMEQQRPMKVLLGHGMVRDDHGEEMHKAKGNSIAFEGAADDGYELKEKGGKPHKHPPMGSDLMRWMYCRNNPAANINFGPHLAEEVRSKLVMKLWNTYAFFCNYARLDSFDPSAAQVPVKDRPDIDRWILSDLQLLIDAAHAAFKAYNVMAFCLKAEEFVDDKLSNWYVRRNRRRFWKSEQGADKLAAYQTLYTVLVTLTKLCAPVIPFMTEKMYRNLVPNAHSVHLCDYPIASESDHELSAEMNALLRLVSMGNSLRETIKINKRKPLAELRVQTNDQIEAKAVLRFADQIRDELNVKKVCLHDPLIEQWQIVYWRAKPNIKNLGARYGSRLPEVLTAFQEHDAEMLVVKKYAGETVEHTLPNGEKVHFEPNDSIVESKPKHLGWASSHDRFTILAIDANVTSELELEGLAREIVRHVQNARKDATLQMDNRIALRLAAEEPKLKEAIRGHRDYIANETLVSNWATERLGGLSHTVEAKIDGMALTIELKRADA